VRSTDSFFASERNRAIAERKVLNGFIAPGAARQIVNNDVLVQVEIYGHGATGAHINILVD
jgi:hypothetical protein